MYNFGKVFVWTCVLFYVVDANLPFGPPHHQGLANLLFGSKDPQVAFACFGDYISNLNTTGVEYKQNYTACLTQANESRQKVDIQMNTNRRSLAATAQDICAGWERCNSSNSSLDVFLCHAKEGPIKAKDAYSISDRADEYAKELSERYHEINSNQESCCKTAEREYAKECTDLYQKLKVCLREGPRPQPTPMAPWLESTVGPRTTVVGPHMSFKPPVTV